MEYSIVLTFGKASVGNHVRGFDALLIYKKGPSKRGLFCVVHPLNPHATLITYRKRLS
jgi:hypothetical protein